MDGTIEDGIGVKTARIMYPLFAGQAIGIIFTAMTFIIVARILGPSQYGLYTFALGFAALVNGFLAFGVGPYFSSNLAGLMRKKDGEGILTVMGSGYIIAGALGVILTLFGIGISGFVSGAFSNVGISPIILELAAGTIAFNILNIIGVSALIGFSRTALASLVNLLVDMVQLALSILLTVNFGVKGAVAAMLIGYGFGAVLAVYLVYRVFSKHFKFKIYVPNLAQIRKVFSVVWPLGVTNFLNTGMQNFSILFLGLFVTTATLGNYGAASRGLALLSTIYLSLGSGLLPVFATAKEMFNKPHIINETYNKIIRFTLIIILPVVMYVGALSIPGLSLLVGSQYDSAPLYLTLIAIGTMIGLFGTYINQLFISGGHTRSVMKINFISAIVQLVLMVIIVPYAKVIGAIFVIFFIGNMIEAVMFAKDAQKLFGLKMEFRKLLMLYIGNIALGLVLAALYLGSSAYVAQLSSLYNAAILVAGLVVLLLVYPAILIALKVVDRGDIKEMHKIVGKLGRIGTVFSSFFDYSEYLQRHIGGE